MESSSMEKGGRSTGSKLTRQRSRLQMHAPSSIEVAPTAAAAASVAEWKVAIPLLSPLDIVSLPDVQEITAEDTRQPSDEREKQTRRATEWSTWQRAVAPLPHEPVNGDGSAFLLPNGVK